MDPVQVVQVEGDSRAILSVEDTARLIIYIFQLQGRGYQPGQRQSGGSGVPGYHGPAAPRPQHQHHQQPRPQDHQPRPAVQPGVFDTSTLMHSLQQQQQRPPAPVAPAAAPRPAAPAPPAPRPAPVPVGAEPEEEKKLSKSAKAKLRKKMREAKA
ncbi:hypothetical protein NADE_003928 [Nannochloris sp. 'desiccata']|nr:hypothetical protein NADE_003928 [Chlorella desiccata (nom. nud.)]